MLVTVLIFSLSSRTEEYFTNVKKIFPINVIMADFKIVTQSDSGDNIDKKDGDGSKYHEGNEDRNQVMSKEGLMDIQDNTVGARYLR